MTVPRIPSKTTLRRYGLSAQDWADMFYRQDGKCIICNRLFNDKVKPVIDHFHLKGWKKKKPTERAKYVRGLACVFCNFRRLNRNITLECSRNTVTYLEAYEARKKLLDTP